ncbi:MAG: DUF4038 domain-containing protein [Bacteroidota bacterium]
MRNLFSTLLCLCLLISKAEARVLPVKLKCYDFHEFLVQESILPSDNPFLETGLSGKFIAPSGKVMQVNGFYDGGGEWKLRFAPNETGIWKYKLSGPNKQFHQTGKLNCIKGKLPGFIGIHPKNPYAFAYGSGIPFFPMGDTSYGLYDDSPVTRKLRTAYLDLRRSQSFNFIRMEVCHSQAHGTKDKAYWPWGGTAQQPDLDRFNPVFFKGLDTLLLQMRSKGMNAELILLNFYRLPFTDTKQWTPVREKRWLRYLLARYAAFSNVFMWTISNEYETHPDGAYRLDDPADVEWVSETAKFITANDAYQHLVTVHPVISSSTTGTSPRAAIEHPWRIGGFFGKESAISVLSQQTGQNGPGTSWNKQKGFWEGDDINLARSIRADRIYGKPVMNTENGYEYLEGQATMKQQVHSTDKVRHASWSIVCSGGYFAAGFNGTLAHSDIWNQIDYPNRYIFSLKDEGAAAQLKILYKFFSSVSFWTMNPHDDLTGNAVALSDSTTCVVYLPAGGNLSLGSITSGLPAAQWFNPRSGINTKADLLKAEGRLNFRAPDTCDWVLLLRQKS